MKSLCIFCASSDGSDEVFTSAAREAARSLARRGVAIVYGGGRRGLMGIVADSALELGGKVVGVIPKGLVERELSHQGLAELHVTEDMHERKRLMAELSDGFLVLPGGFGTLEELSEILSSAQMGLHAKPCGILNVNGFFDHLLAFFDEMVRAGFLHERSRRLPLVGRDCEDLIGAICAAGMR